MYVIVRHDGMYVARRGQMSSYVRCLQHARCYRTREEAEQDMCAGSERVAAIRDIMGQS